MINPELLMSSKHLKRYCKECGNITHLQKTISNSVMHPMTYVVLSLMIVSVLGLAKLLIS